jgi:exodeoxyribonuclease VII large subunit
MRGRHAAELTHDLRRLMRAALASRERGFQKLRLTLESFDQRRRLGTVRARLLAADGRLAVAVRRRTHASGARLGALAGRLESLSPLAVLGRGYAVCWNGDGTAIVRDAAAMRPGDRVRVTLERGEIDCSVTGIGRGRHDNEQEPR